MFFNTIQVTFNLRQWTFYKFHACFYLMKASSVDCFYSDVIYAAENPSKLDFNG
jgi:hypothetical protein